MSRSLQGTKEEKAFQAEGNTQKKAQRCEKVWLWKQNQET